MNFKLKKFDDLVKLRLTKEEIEDIHRWAVNERMLLMKKNLPKSYEKEERRHDRAEEAEEAKHEKRHDKAMIKAIKGKKKPCKDK